MRVALRHLLRAAAPALLGVSCAAPAQVPVRQAGDAIFFEGQINAGTAAAFLRLLQDPAVTRLVIRSGGGHVAPALDMAEALHARQLDIEVPVACRSSCANYLFPAARRKLLGRPDVVSWHGNMQHILHLERIGQGQWSGSEMLDARRLAAREAQFFRRIGVDGFVTWFAKIPPYNVEDAYYLSVDDMARFGIGRVTVRDPAAPPDGAAVLVRVDWATLDALRPAGR